MSLARTLKSFWAARAPREQRILLAGGAALALLAFYLLLVAPAAEGVQRLQRQLPLARERSAQLDALLAEARTLRNQPQAAVLGPADARAALDKSLESAGIAGTHTDALPNGDLRLRFSAVPYGKWAAWLAGAERSLGVRAVAVHVKKLANGPAAPPGSTDIDLTLHLVRAG